MKDENSNDVNAFLMRGRHLKKKKKESKAEAKTRECPLKWTGKAIAKENQKKMDTARTESKRIKTRPVKCDSGGSSKKRKTASRAGGADKIAEEKKKKTRTTTVENLSNDRTKRDSSAKTDDGNATTANTATVGSDRWILNQNPFFLSAEHKARRKALLKMKKKSKSGQSAIEKLRKHESMLKKQDMEMQKAFGRSANPFFAQVGRAIRRQALKKETEAIDLTHSPRPSTSDKNFRWIMPHFPRTSIVPSDARFPPPDVRNPSIFSKMTPSALKPADVDPSILSKILSPRLGHDDVGSVASVEVPITNEDASLVSSVRLMQERLFQGGHHFDRIDATTKTTECDEDDAERDRILRTEQEAERLTRIARAMRERAKTSSAHSLLYQRYRPRKPEEVVGSSAADISAQLCAWLKQWQKRFTAERKAERRALRRKLKQYACFDNADHDYIDSQLNQTVRTGYVLEGAVGAGKTSIVYACARSLGVEVIEINTGSRRSRKDILHMFGEATQSKRLAMQQQKDKALPAPSKSRKRSGRKRKSRVVDDDDETDADVESSAAQSEGKEARMSVILFEDIDVVLKTDVGFIGAVRNFLKRAKCPVVMTARRCPPSLRRIASEESNTLRVREIRMPSMWERILWIAAACATEGVVLNAAQTLRLLQRNRYSISRALQFVHIWKSRVVSALELRSIDTLKRSAADLVRYPAAIESPSFDESRALRGAFVCISSGRIVGTPSDAHAIRDRRRASLAKRGWWERARDVCPAVVAVEPESGVAEGGTVLNISLRLPANCPTVSRLLQCGSEKEQKQCRRLFEIAASRDGVFASIGGRACNDVAIVEWRWDAKPEPALVVRATSPPVASLECALWPQDVVVRLGAHTLPSNFEDQSNGLFSYIVPNEEADGEDDQDDDVAEDLTDPEEDADRSESKVKEQSVAPEEKENVDVELRQIEATTTPTNPIDADLRDLARLRFIASDMDSVAHVDMIAFESVPLALSNRDFVDIDCPDAQLAASMGRHIAATCLEMGLGSFVSSASSSKSSDDDHEDASCRCFSKSLTESMRAAGVSPLLSDLVSHGDFEIQREGQLELCNNILRSSRDTTRSSAKQRRSTDYVAALNRICTIQKRNADASSSDFDGGIDAGVRRRLRRSTRRRSGGSVHYLDQPNVRVYISASQKRWLERFPRGRFGGPAADRSA